MRMKVAQQRQILSWIFTVLLLLLSNILLTSDIAATAKDLYARLGLKKGANEKEIKKAYRQKARDTHPDKNPNVDPEVAASEFRDVAEAYEVLSDERQRREYDRTGQTAQQRDAARRDSTSRYRQQQQRQQQQQQRYGSNGDWTFNFNFGWSSGGFRPDSQIRYHSLYKNAITRRHVLQCQGRVLKVTGLPHLQRIALDDETELTDRFLLLAVYDSRIPQCEQLLDYFVMYPWPFAGYSRENDNSMWWEEIILATKIDLAQDTQMSRDLAQLLGINFADSSSSSGGDKERCPAVAFFPRQSRLTTFEIWSLSAQDDPKKSEFREFVWQQLRMSVRIKNKTPWKLQQWWLDGSRGKQLEDIEPEEEYHCQTYLSHSFIYRAAFVEGRLLNNQSSVFWYTSRIQDDGQVVSIYPRCFDHHSDCPRWAKEGFCDANSRGTRSNPGWHHWVSQHCFVSCTLPGCDSADNSI